ncbi:hypothetical protein TNCV_4139031 [Trichonephila clavipes]|nr:hypothetical protein TNCV_4139031 [Trichonephila clavipes]
MGSTLNSRQVASPVVRLVEGDEKRPLTLLQGVRPQTRSGTEINRTVTCMVLKATTNDRCTSSPLPR